MSLPRSTAKAVAIGGIALSTIAVGVVAANAAPTALPALTADTDDTDDTSTSDGGSPVHGPGMRGRHGVEITDLAEKLGVEDAALEDAMANLRETRREEGRSAIAAALAEELGLDEEVVTTAFEELRTEHRASARTGLVERLDAAVEEGTLTEADKAAVLKALDAGLLGRGPGGPGGRR